MNPELARRLLTALDEQISRGRTRADADGDPGPLRTARSTAVRALAGAAELAEASVRRDLLSVDPATAGALDRHFEAPLAAEAELRGALARVRARVAGRERTLAEVMRDLRDPSEARRAAAEAALDAPLEELAETHGLEALVTRLAGPETPPQVPARRAAPPMPLARAGALLLPSADLVQALSAGGPLDPAVLAGLAAGAPLELSAPPGSAPPRPAAPSGLIEAPTPEELARLSSASGPSTARGSVWAELRRALASAARDRVPDTYGAWRAAAAGADVADFRVRDGLLARWAPARARFLPFEQPLVPLARPGALVAAAPDAAATIAQLLGLGVARGEPLVGAALAVTAASRPFLSVALTDRPSDALRAARTIALAVVTFAHDAELARAAAGAPEALRDLTQDALGAAPSATLARWWAVELGLARAPGEAHALYRSTPRLAELLTAGATLASRLRDAFDEDWFRNPRVTSDVLRELSVLDGASDEAALGRWLREHAEL